MASQPFPVLVLRRRALRASGERLDISKAGTGDDGQRALPRQRPSFQPPAGSEGQLLIRISGMRQALLFLTWAAWWFLSPDSAREQEMTTAFIFPGQGSQAVGMGKSFADAFPVAKALFDEVDEALGAKLTEIMWEGPLERLTLTENAQPALMAVSLAAIRVLEAEAGLDLPRDVAFVAGHS